MSLVCNVDGFEFHLLAQGYPGKSVANGGLGWSTVGLLKGNGLVALLDTGSFSLRKPLLARLKKLGIDRHMVTDVVLTHSHYDHMMNWTLFPEARVHISQKELEWALSEPIETSLGAELYIRALAESDQLRFIDPEGPVLERVETFEAPGHTPHHLVLSIQDADNRVLFAADAVKNRAELLSEKALSTLDEAASARTIAAVKRIWLDHPGAILVCGHDLPIVNLQGGMRLVGQREAAITAWLGEDVADATAFSLTK